MSKKSAFGSSKRPPSNSPRATRSAPSPLVNHSSRSEQSSGSPEMPGLCPSGKAMIFSASVRHRFGGVQVEVLGAPSPLASFGKFTKRTHFRARLRNGFVNSICRNKPISARRGWAYSLTTTKQSHFLVAIFPKRTHSGRQKWVRAVFFDKTKPLLGEGESDESKVGFDKTKPFGSSRAKGFDLIRGGGDSATRAGSRILGRRTTGGGFAMVRDL